MKPIARNRSIFELSNKKLRRARRLYIFLCRNSVKTTIDLHRVAKAMAKTGLYADNRSDRDVKFAILRYLWKFDGGHDRPWPNPMCWHEWCNRTGWDIAHRCRDPRMEAVA